jgi:hypothetical protein
MALDPAKVQIYHITDVDNLPGILADGGLYSDKAMADRAVVPIGYAHIKERRMKKTQVPCCGNRFVGEFVPFYYCPRSPMLFAVNKGLTQRTPGCQRSIVHLVSTVHSAIRLERAWAISDVNAGSDYPNFFSELDALDRLQWSAIRARQWSGIQSQKAAEFLVADFFPWEGFEHIGCHNAQVKAQVEGLLLGRAHRPVVTVREDWYY